MALASFNSVRAQTPGDLHSNLNAILQQLLSLYPTAKATADGTDLVTAGAVLVLQKDNLLMDKVDLRLPTLNVYKDGAILHGGLSGFLGHIGAHVLTGATDAPNDYRTFVTGEKIWVTLIDVLPDAVEFRLMSDPIADQRYHATLRFPFAKGAAPTPDDVAAMVSEALKIDSGDGGAGAGQEKSARNQGPQPAAAPPVETKTIALGQTRDQVIANFGVPSKIVQLGTKEIDYFPDMKVTFVQNKVADVN
jgi:hypothetical protein